MEKYLKTGAITAELAEKMIEAAVAKARELNVAVNIAIVDSGAHLKAFRRMDGAPLLSIGIAQRKAYSAVAFNMPTNQWYDLLKESPALLTGFPHTPDLIIFGGGFPIVVDGITIGGIGISGGSEQQDELIAEAALAVAQG